MDLGALLGALPDNVKRSIVARLDDVAAEQQQQPQQQQQQQLDHAQEERQQQAPEPAAGRPQPSTRTAAHGAGADPSAAAAQLVAARRVELPPMHGGACVVDGCLTTEEVQVAAAALEAHLAVHGKRAGMGGASSGGLWHAPSARGDTNCWATPDDLDAVGQPLLAATLRLLASLRSSLAAQGFDVGGRCSCQLVCYPGDGARYVRHADASPSAPERSITALLYLNPPGWDAQADGGQLVLYNAAHTRLQQAHADSSSSSSSLPQGDWEPAGYLAGEPALVVSPVGGRLLVFDSRLQHEVLPAHRRRLSITAFFYKQKQQQQQQHTPGPAASQPSLCAPAAAAADIPRSPSGPMGPTPHQAAAAADASTASSDAPGKQPADGPPLPRIFVSVAAFRDEECQWTLRDLLVKAAHPQRVSVGVVWQVDPQEDAAFVRVAGGARTAPYLAQVREVRLHCSAATGPCAARSLAQQLWAGEEYVLQVDAHMRFVQGWDELCLAELRAAQQAAGSARVVLSTYPPGYSGEGAAAALPDEAPTTLLCAKGFDDAGMLHITGRSLRARPAGPLPCSFWAAGFSFAPSAWLLEVPCCPHLRHLFFGEEQHMLLRMVTRGWQVWAPSRPIAFHQWERSARPRSFQACVKVDAHARADAQARVLQLNGQHLGDTAAASLPSCQAASASSCSVQQPPSAADWGLGGVWGLGTARSLREYEAAAGVSFADRLVHDRARWGGHAPELFLD